MAFASARASLEQQSALEQEVASLRDPLAAAASTPTMEFESNLTFVQEGMAVARKTIGKYHAEVQTRRNQMDYDSHRD